MIALGSRSLFPTLRAESYLAHCAISPLSAAVTSAMSAYAASYAENGVQALPRWLEQRNELRGRLAQLIGAEAADIAFVASTTAGVIDVAWSIPWRGERIVLFDREFPTNVTPWRQVAKTFGLRVTVLPITGFGDGSGRGLQRLEDELGFGGVRIVAVSAVQFQTGLAMPLDQMGELCHAHGAELFVDGIQGVGVVPIDVRNVDYLVAGGHNWLMGPEGSAFAYVAPSAAEELVPRLAGWLSHEDPVGFLTSAGPPRPDRPFRRRADVFEVGMTHGAALAGLSAGLVPFERLGVEMIHAHVQDWHDAIEPELLQRGFRSYRAREPDARSGILSVRVPPGVDVQRVARQLGDRGVVVSAPEDHLRLAPHWPNDLREIPVILDAIDAVVARAR